MIDISEKKIENTIKQKNINFNFLDEKNEPQFLTKAHKDTYEKAVKNRKKLDLSKIDWDKEIEIQRINSRND